LNADPQDSARAKRLRVDGLSVEKVRRALMPTACRSD